nr:hypothetical protein BaRGS_035063 [Batillaria attramentaria]
MQVLHPAAKMLVELSKAQDIEAGDGTTSVVILAGSLLDASSKLLAKGIHPTTISESFQKAAGKCVEILESMVTPLDLSDRESLLKSASTSLNSKMENQVIVSDYTQMDRVLREERNYILEIVKKIKKAGCNVLLIQKSILRDAVSDLALHFLAKMKIMVVKDIEREDVEFVCKTLGCRPIASVDHFLPENLGSAELVEEVQTGTSKIVKVTGIANPGQTVSVLIRGSNKLVLEEADRSLHDALCVIRCLVKKRALVAGGGAPEIELSLRLAAYANTLSGMEQYCFRAFAEALEVIPFTLAENAGLNPISTVTDLRTRHAQGELTAGINVRKGAITNILEENVLQPLLVSTSAITLASETVRSILKIDDIICSPVAMTNPTVFCACSSAPRFDVVQHHGQDNTEGCVLGSGIQCHMGIRQPVGDLESVEVAL